MVNRYRGEAALRLGDDAYTLCLTLDALARLESALDCDDLATLLKRLAGDGLTAATVKAVLTEALVAGGQDRDQAVGLIAQADRPLDLTTAYADLVGSTFSTRTS